MVGFTIENATKDKDKPIYPFETAVARIEAMAAATDAFGFAFHLTWRCENFLRAYTDLDDTIRELKGYEDAGAKVLIASGLPDREAVKTVCSALSKPFNFMVGIPGWAFDVASLRASGASVLRGRRCGDGNPRPRHIRICRNGFALVGRGRIHGIARMTTLLLFFLQAGHQLNEIAGSKPAVQLVV